MNLKNISKTLSFILRHNPEQFNLTMDDFGWVDVQKLVDAMNINTAMLVSIVNEDSKGRYAFNEDTTLIRATQGHSRPVILDIVNIVEVFQPVYHGTATRFLDSILAQGLIPNGRQYVHMAYDLQQAEETGRRHGKPVVLLVNVNQAIKDGIKFIKSQNGYVLTEHVPAKYLEIHDVSRDINSKNS